VAYWSTNAAISVKRVKIDEKLLWRAYRKSQTLFRTVPSRPPTASPSPRLGLATHPNTAIAIISGTGKATNFKFGRYIQSVHANKNPLKIWEKRKRGRIQRLPLFGVPHIFQEWVKLRTSNLARIFTASQGPSEQKPLKNLGKKWSVGVSRAFPNFSSTPYYRRNT